MRYDTYGELRAAVQLLLLGGDLNDPVDDITSFDNMISLGEALVHYGGSFAIDGRYLGPLRASSMETALDVAVADNAAPLPADCLELSVLWLDDGVPLEIVAERDLRSRLKYFPSGPARKAAQAGDSVIFSPVAEDGAVLGGRYYAKPPALKDELHATYNRYPELYVYAALAAAAPHFGMDGSRYQVSYVQLLDQANNQERNRVSAGGRLRQVSR